MLVNHGAVVDAVDPDCLTAVHVAAGGGHVHALEALLELGASPSSRYAVDVRVNFTMN
jgi:ankyrin repeat protein